MTRQDQRGDHLEDEVETQTRNIVGDRMTCYYDIKPYHLLAEREATCRPRLSLAPPAHLCMGVKRGSDCFAEP
jgi:hypothetical protein